MWRVWGDDVDAAAERDVDVGRVVAQRHPMKLIAAILTLVALLLGGSGCSATSEAGARIYHVVTMTRPADVSRRALPDGIESVCSRGSITWIVPVSADGKDVVLVDTGFDQEARAIKYKVGDRTIKAILLTHAHLDHAAGTAALDVPVYVGRDDAAALRGKNHFRALWPSLGEAFAGVPKALGPVHAVDDGDVYAFDGQSFRAVATPGHTTGSTSWLFRTASGQNVLFGGDAVQTPEDGEVHPAPWGFTYDVNAAYDSIRKLRELDVDYLADAHIGVLPQPHDAFRRAVERQHSAETLNEYPFNRPMGCADDPI